MTLKFISNKGKTIPGWFSIKFNRDVEMIDIVKYDDIPDWWCDCKLKIDNNIIIETFQIHNTFGNILVVNNKQIEENELLESNGFLFSFTTKKIKNNLETLFCIQIEQSNK